MLEKSEGEEKAFIFIYLIIITAIFTRMCETLGKNVSHVRSTNMIRFGGGMKILLTQIVPQFVHLRCWIVTIPISEYS